MYWKGSWCKVVEWNSWTFKCKHYFKYLCAFINGIKKVAAWKALKILFWSKKWSVSLVISRKYRSFYHLILEHVVLHNVIYILSAPGVADPFHQLILGFFIPSLIGNSKPFLETSIQIFFILTFIPPTNFSYLYKGISISRARYTSLSQ